jgi:ABC-type polysaccharide transport system, permease component
MIGKSSNKSESKRKSFGKTLGNQWQLMMMSIPFAVLCIVFSYLPLSGWAMAFQNFKPGKGMWEQKWVGLQQFKILFTSGDFGRVMRNTLAMSIINLVLSFSTAIILALLLNEVRNRYFKRTVQTISYMPHFLSWVIAAGIISNCLAYDGIINDVLMACHFIKEPILWLQEGTKFWGIIGFSNVWKEVGWNTIIYLGAMTSIDPSLYEAVSVDGGGRWYKMRYITLPGIRSTFIILLIMSIGHIMEAGFEQQFLLQKGATMQWAETIDIYVLKWGIQQGNYSLATAAGIFKSVISIILLFAVNNIAKKFDQERLF